MLSSRYDSNQINRLKSINPEESLLLMEASQRQDNRKMMAPISPDDLQPGSVMLYQLGKSHRQRSARLQMVLRKPRRQNPQQGVNDACATCMRCFEADLVHCYCFLFSCFKESFSFLLFFPKFIFNAFIHSVFHFQCIPNIAIIFRISFPNAHIQPESINQCVVRA